MTFISEWALVIITVALTYFTFILAKEASKTRKQNIRPNIDITIEPVKTNIMQLVIENTGRGTAYDINITADPNFATHKNTKINEMSFMNIPILKPSSKIVHFIGQFQDIEKGPIKFNISLKDSENNVISEERNFHASFYSGITNIAMNEKNRARDALVNIDKNLTYVITGSKKINVDIYTEKDREKAAKELVDNMKSLRNLIDKEAK